MFEIFYRVRENKVESESRRFTRPVLCCGSRHLESCIIYGHIIVPFIVEAAKTGCPALFLLLRCTVIAVSVTGKHLRLYYVVMLTCCAVPE